ncbi:bifunctional glycosyltransferase/CDP-glycerol:glycerophosphate glycerophosphotransferase [Actinomadura alba]|uniref:Bifunctional glycosyltransferase family 2 protein/CDP-glycerol:glycerophosphate glycerophosphotransferase n=1 Tax=Actinomadura alba TaxID=406431 RepID=A0ABR7LJ52_9ACTN|nr:bifunctional glycosyltransferase family 2 protein/CDP-glycerol:glycerophosphate glycerophosphotransferase [Actinomadura alba]MBC6464784.1 bifunctional glycosyltransferase family 2 protein/CDP-glycerol:glycerophosphate glycerophosphotransferase [Actinomadura alba]
MNVTISVIVSTHAAGARLAETLWSVAAQSHDRLEVLVVDDGAGAAASVRLPDERFRLVRAGAPSRGAARNVGVAQATGGYLAFVDGGDVLLPGGLRALAETLAETGSDLAAGNVGVRRERVIAPSRTHQTAFTRTLLRTHIARHPALLQDRYVTNKLFRRRFWDEHALSFPDVNRYDDLVVSIAAHHLAGSVDVLRSTVVVRGRDGWPEPTAEPREIADGYTAVSAVFARLDGTWRAKDRLRFQTTALDRELRVFLDAMPDAGADERVRIVERAAAYAEGVDPRAFTALPALTRLKWHLASRRLVTELVKLVRFERGGTSPAIVRDPVRRFVVYPYWKDDSLAIPRAVYRARREVAMRGRAHEVRWVDGRLRITGEAYINSVGMRRRWTSVKAVILRSEDGGLVLLRARQTPRPGRASGAWTGFEVTIDPRRLRRRRWSRRTRWADGTWNVEVAVLNAGIYRSGALRGGVSGTGANPPYGYVADGVRVVPLVADGGLRLRIETVRARATALRWSGGALEIEGTAEDGVAVEPVLSRPDVPVPVPIPVTVHAGGFTARLEHAVLADDPADRDPDQDPDADPEVMDDTRDRTVSLGGEPLALAEGVEDAVRLVGARELVAGRGVGGYLRIRTRSARMTVTSCAWREPGVFELSGTHPAPNAGSEPRGDLVLRARGRRKEHAFAMTFDRDELRGRVPAAAIATLGGPLPLRPGRWDVLFRPAGGRALAVRLDGRVGERLPSAVEVALRGYTLEDHDGRLVLEVTGDLRPEERSAGTRLRDEARRRVARDGLRDTVLFSCFNGRQYSDSTRAIHEELVRRGCDLEQLWVVDDAQVELPGTLRAVRLNGAEWHDAMASSRYIVTNHRLGDRFHRHPGQVVLQTWHGTPLKKIGRDVKEVHFAYAPGMRKALRPGDLKGPALPEWTHLLSPNPFSTEILRRALAFDGDIIETGYPRNDVLHSPRANEIAARVRSRLGLPDGKKVVLYAPTWRDDQYYGRGRYRFDMRIDLARARAALGDDHVLLVRLHSNIVDGVPGDGDGFVHDVSPYPDIAELYLVADLLITDYSSVMFDYANTRRPMLFFTYDLRDYRDRLRGFYFDFGKEAPGPLIETSDALIDAVRSADDTALRHRPAYDAFVRRFCPLDDGRAAARVVDGIFPGTS